LPVDIIRRQQAKKSNKETTCKPYNLGFSTRKSFELTISICSATVDIVRQEENPLAE
jgi:hypothetical protein